MGKGGDNNPENGESSCLSDARFYPFRQEEFKAAEFTSRILAGSHTTAQAKSEELQESVRILDQELSSHIVSRHKELLHHCKKLNEADHALQDVFMSVDSLKGTVKRMRLEVACPYDQINLRTVQLRNLHATINLLRSLTYRIKLVQKLKTQMESQSNALDLAKAAKLITDIVSVDQEADFTNIEIVAAHNQYIDAATATIREQAQAAMLEGLESLSQTKVGSALQVFFNLGELEKAVTSVLSRYVVDVDKSIKTALDSRQLGLGLPGSTGLLAGPGGARGLSTPVPGTTTSWQEKLWAGLKEVLDLIQTLCASVWHIQRVVAKKRDPLTHVCFLDVLVQPGEPLLTQRFWSDLVKVVGDTLASSARPSKASFVRELLVSGYPKLASILESMHEKLVAETTLKGTAPAVGPEELEQLLEATAPYKSAYLAACLTHMADTVSSAFPGGSKALPSPADVQKCIGAMHDGLKLGGSTPKMSGMVAEVVGKVLLLLAEKAEYMAATGADVRTLGVTANAAQIRNIALCSQLQEVQRSLAGLLPRLPPTASIALAKPFEIIQRTGTDVVLFLFKSAMDAMEDILAKMHIAPGLLLGAEPAEGAGMPVVATSPYMLELLQLIVLFKSEYLSRFVPPPAALVPTFASALVQRMGSRLLLLFARHAALIRPLTQTARLQLAKDMAELQLAVSQHLYPLERLGLPFKQLRAFRSLLFLEDSQVVTSPLLKELPPTVLLHHLFSRLPPQIQSPYERAELTPAQYSMWLDEHSQDEVLQHVEESIVAKQGAQADPRVAELCNLMLTWCEVSK